MSICKFVELKVKEWIEYNFEGVKVILVGDTPLDHSGIDALLIINNIIRTMQIKSSPAALTEKDTRTLIKYGRNVDIVFYDRYDLSQTKKIEEISEMYNLQVISYEGFKNLYDNNGFNTPKDYPNHVKTMINRIMLNMEINYTDEYIIKLEKELTSSYIRKNKIKINDNNNDTNSNVDTNNDIKIKINYTKKKKENNENNNIKKDKQSISGYRIVNIRYNMTQLEKDYAYLNEIDKLFMLKTELNNLYNKIMNSKYRGKNKLIVALILKNGYDKIGITLKNPSVKHKDLEKLYNIIDIITKLKKKYKDVDIDAITGVNND